MNVSPEEARASLVTIHQTQTQMKKLVGITGYFSIIWGLVWFLGLLGNQYLPENDAWVIWAPACVVGWILSTILGIHLGKQTRSPSGTRMAFFWLALGGFAVLWFLVMQPASWKQDSLFIMTVFMFGGMAVGIIERVLPLIICNLSMAALLVIGYYLVPAYFFLWAAIFCGLAMVGIGLVMRLYWR
jgi:hypothetical protein